MYRQNITQTVWSYISKDLAIQKSLHKGLLNIRALAKHIQKEQNLKTSTDSVISAIRRYTTHKKSRDSLVKMEESFRNSNIITRNNMACIIIKNQSEIQKYLSEISKIMDFNKGEVLRLIKGRSSLRILTDMKNIEKITGFFSRKDISIKENLSEIKIKINPKAERTKGVIARLSNELLMHDINISEIIFCVPEIIIYLDQKDLLAAHKGIVHLCNKI